jgi:hypothetical protein
MHPVCLKLKHKTVLAAICSSGTDPMIQTLHQHANPASMALFTPSAKSCPRNIMASAAESEVEAPFFNDCWHQGQFLMCWRPGTKNHCHTKQRSMSHHQPRRSTFLLTQPKPTSCLNALQGCVNSSPLSPRPAASQLTGSLNNPEHSGPRNNRTKTETLHHNNVAVCHHLDNNVSDSSHHQPLLFLIRFV